MARSDTARPKTRLLVVGGSSYVGTACQRALRDSFEVSATSRTGAGGTLALDLGRPEAFDYAAIRPGDGVLVCAAISSPDVCANDHRLAQQVNVTGPKYFAQKTVERGANVLFLSSDTVLGPTEQPADENAPVRPAGAYANMKCEMENFLLAETPAKIVRLSLVMSLQDKFTRYVRDCVRRGSPPSLLHPLYRNAVHLADVTRLIGELLGHWPSHSCRIVHAGGSRCLSRIGLAEQLFGCLGYSGGYAVDRPGAEFYQNRPERIELRSLHLAALLGREPLAIAAGYAGELAHVT